MSAPTLPHASLPGVAPRGTVRACGETDRDALRRFFDGLSPASSVARFHGEGFRPTDVALDLLMGRHVPGRALVAEADGEIVGHAVWSVLPRRSDVAELGVVVADGWQGGGTGTQLADTAIRDAAAHGVATVVVPVLEDDRASRHLVRGLLPAATGERDGHVVEYRADIAPLRNRR